ncbi:MAG: choice-of-anchor B family protein [Actinomycetota bacterium]
MKRLSRRRRRVVLLPLTALSLVLLAPTLPAGAHKEHIQQITDMILADRQDPLFTEAVGPAACENGFAGPFPCKNVDLQSFVPLAELGGATGNDIWGWTDPVTAKEFAIMGTSNGTAFVDVSDPMEPVVIGTLPTHSGASLWRDVKVFKNHAFIVADLAEEHGMQVFDLTRLRNVLVTPTVFTEDAHYAGFGDSHNVAINEETGFAYAVGTFDNVFFSNCGSGLHMIDVNDPTDPKFAGCFSEDGYTHDVECVIYRGPDGQHRGKEICFASNEDTLTIVDVTDKAGPVMLSRTTYPGVGYTHQGWLTDNERTFVLDDESDEQENGHNTRTRFFDVSDLDAPFLDFVFDGPTKAIDHNLYVIGNRVYESNYRAGLRILETDIRKDRAAEVAFFDVYPPDDEAEFNGSWSNYPFFASGNVVVSGIEEGLFVLRPTLPRGKGGKGGPK